jgi:iron complex outermembrane receptor protein
VTDSAKSPTLPQSVPEKKGAQEEYYLLGEVAMQLGVRRGNFIGALVGLAVGAGLCLPTPASAEIQTVVVTVNKRVEEVIEIASSIQAISGEALEAAGIETMDELGDIAPGFRITKGVTMPNNASMGMRGLSTAGGNSQLDPSVGVFLDGVFLPRPVTVLQQFSDIKAVEILKGPQGTLYGRNTPVAAININSNLPTREFEARGSASFGYDKSGNKSYKISSLVNGPLTDQIAGRLAIFKFGDGGGYENIHPGGPEDREAGYGARLRLLYEPSDNLDINFIADYSYTESQCCTHEWLVVSPNVAARRAAIGYTNRGDSNPLDHKIDNDDKNSGLARGWGFSLRGDLDLAVIGLDDYQFVSITAFRNFYDHYAGPPDDDPARILDASDNLNWEETFSQEFQLKSPDDQFLEWIGGVYFYHNNTVFENSVGFGVDRDRMCSLFPAGQRVAFGFTAACTPGTALVGVASTDVFKQDANSVAGFGQATVNLTDRFSVTGGLRYTWDRKTGFKWQPVNRGCSQCSAIFAADRVKSTKLTWLASTKFWVIPDEMQVYFTVATGFKSSGINGTPDRASGGILTPLTFSPENTKNYEVGTKMQLFDNRLMTNLSLYRMIISDFQTRTRTPSGVGNYTVNSGIIRHLGGELEVRAEPVEWLALGLVASYLDSKQVTSSPAVAAGVAIPGTVSCAPGVTGAACPSNHFVGRPLASAPQWEFLVTGEVKFPVINTGTEWFVRSDVNYTGGQYYSTDLNPIQYQQQYAVLNLRTGLRGGDGMWQVSLWARNVTNTRYFVTASPGLGQAFTRAQDSYVIQLGEARRIGIDGSIKY